MDKTLPRHLNAEFLTLITALPEKKQHAILDELKLGIHDLCDLVQFEQPLSSFKVVLDAGNHSSCIPIMYYPNTMGTKHSLTNLCGKYGRVDVSELLFLPPTFESMTKAVCNGHLKYVQWGFSQGIKVNFDEAFARGSLQYAEVHARLESKSSSYKGTQFKKVLKFVIDSGEFVPLTLSEKTCDLDVKTVCKYNIPVNSEEMLATLKKRPKESLMRLC